MQKENTCSNLEPLQPIDGPIAAIGLRKKPRKIPLRPIVYTVLALAMVALSLIVILLSDPVPTREQPSSNVVSPSSDVLEARRKEARERENKRYLLSLANSSHPDCEEIKKLNSPINIDVCVALASAIENGRTTYEARGTLLKYLEEGGYKKIRGYMVHEHDTNIYEIAISGRRTRALLKTNYTTYTSQGWFTIWAEKVNSIPIRTVNGFEQMWDVYEENSFGSGVQKIFSAPAGESTTEAAREVMLELL